MPWLTYSVCDVDSHNIARFLIFVNCIIHGRLEIMIFSKFFVCWDRNIGKMHKNFINSSGHLWTGLYLGFYQWVVYHETTKNSFHSSFCSITIFSICFFCFFILYPTWSLWIFSRKLSRMDTIVEKCLQVI